MDALTVVLGILGTISSAITGLLYSERRLLRESNGDLRQRLSDQDTKIAGLVEQVSLLTADRDALGRQVRGDDKLDGAIARLDEHNRRLEEHNRSAERHWKREERMWKAMQEAFLATTTTASPEPGAAG